MTDENKKPASNDKPSVLPPRILDQLAMMQKGDAFTAPEPPKKASTVNGILWFLIALSAVGLASIFLLGPIKDWMGDRTGIPEDATFETAPPAPSAPMTPRISAPVPPDAEIDAAPVPPAENDLLAQLDKSLTMKISAAEGGLKPLLGKASLGVLDPKYGLTDDDLKGQNPDARTLASAYQAMFKRMGENLGKDDSVLSDIEYLSGEQDRLVTSLEGKKNLQITKVILCRRVSGYGRYESFNENDFRTNALPMILVYAELVNFKTRSLEAGRYTVNLREELSIETAEGEVKQVWKEHEVSITDVASSLRRDFFIAQYLNLPKTIKPGKYKLQVKIIDEADSQVAVSSAPLTITAE